MPQITIIYTSGPNDVIPGNSLTVVHDPSQPITVTQYRRNGRDIVSIDFDLQNAVKIATLDIAPFDNNVLARQKALARVKREGGGTCSMTWTKSGPNATHARLQIVAGVNPTEVDLTNGLPPPKLRVKVLQPSS